MKPITKTMLTSLRQLSRTRLIIPAQRFTQFMKTGRYGTASASRLLVQQIERNNQNSMLHVTWNNNSVNRYPFMFLRDNCRCPECFHESSCQRSFDTIDRLDLNILPAKLEVTPGGQQLVITWPDDHVSVFDSEWLHSRRLCEDADSNKKASNLNREGVEFWDAKKLQGNIPKNDFRELMEDDRALFQWLNSMHRFGIALVCNTPLEIGQVDKLCERVGHAKTTHYGHYFTVKSKFDANNLAYTTGRLPLHTDLPFYDYPPGVQMLHCVEQVPGTGGANQFADGFHVAQVLKDQDPKKFELLATERLHFFDIGNDMFGDFDMKFTRRMIELDENQRLFRFVYNNHTRDSIMNVSPERAVEMYEAFISVCKMLIDPANQIEYKLRPGDLITFNNNRVLHGRSEFTVTGEGIRLLYGIYIDWDIMYSRLRALARKFNIPINF